MLGQADDRLLFTMSFLDRINIGTAKLVGKYPCDDDRLTTGLTTDLNLNSLQYNTASMSEWMFEL